jgi:hypothetical protein
MEERRRRKLENAKRKNLGEGMGRCGVESECMCINFLLLGGVCDALLLFADGNIAQCNGFGADMH